MISFKISKSKIIIYIFFYIFLILNIYFNNTYADGILDSIYENWRVFKLEKSFDDTQCYIVSFPIQIIGNYDKSNDPYILIARFKESEIEEVSLYSGYDYKLNSIVNIAIDDSQYQMFTKDDLAWNKTPKDDKQMIKDLLSGIRIKNRGESADGKYSVNTFSLNGFVDAYKRMKDMCKE